MDLSRFAEALHTTAGCAGRPAWDPQLMVSLWVYAYSEGIGSAREIERLMEAALEELMALQAEKKAEEKAAVRVSVTEPEARIMKHGDGAMAASYNAQITTEASHKIIVGAHLSQCSSDAQSLKPALEEVEKNLGEKPAQVVVDGGFTNRDNIVDCAAEKIDLVGSLARPEERSEAAMKSQGIDPAFAPHHFCILEAGRQLQCLAGWTLPDVRQSRKRPAPLGR